MRLFGYISSQGKDMFYRLICSLALGLCTASALAQSLPATNHNLTFEGRNSKNYQDGSVAVNWPGSTLKTRFIGSHFALTMQGNGDYFDVLVDGKLSTTLMTQPNGVTETFVLFASESTQNVLIEVVKRTENYASMSRFLSVEHNGSLDGVWGHKPHILFIGDSISAGFGSESDKRECTWEEIYATSNARLAFPYQTGQQLNTTITQVSFSGLGLIRNWGGNQPHHNLTTYTDKVAAVYGLTLDYEDKFPNLIVVEVGTNDFSTDPQAHEPWSNIEEVKQAWTERMVEYVSELKHRYHQVPIILMPRPAYPYDYIIPATQDAIETLAQQEIHQVYSHTFVSPLEGCIWHPTAQEHREIATQLSQFIRQQALLTTP
ncbi:TPA: lipolytic enzyme [Vibrio vulnificus]|nr:lipolytic enzyme [Vibrio vulnificus]